MVQPNAAVAWPDQHGVRRIAGSRACHRHSRVKTSVNATAGSTDVTSRRSVLLATTVLLPLGSSCAEAATVGPLQQQQQQEWLQQQLRRTQHAVYLADVQADYDRCRGTVKILDAHPATPIATTSVVLLLGCFLRGTDVPVNLSLYSICQAQLGANCSIS